MELTEDYQKDEALKRR